MKYYKKNFTEDGKPTDDFKRRNPKSYTLVIRPDGNSFYKLKPVKLK